MHYLRANNLTSKKKKIQCLNERNTYTHTCMKWNIESPHSKFLFLKIITVNNLGYSKHIYPHLSICF